MDAKLLEIGVQLRKIVVFSFTTFYRSVCRNPFLVCIFFFLIFLYRFFPFLFSLLLSASPVLVSTAVLLGTLLSFGHPNIPEIEKEEETVTDEIVSLKTGVPRDSLVVEGDRSYPIERYTNVEDKSIEEASSLANNVSEVDRDESVVPSSPVREESSREFQFEKWVNEEEERELNEEKMGDGKGIENQYSLIQQSDNENDGSEIDNSQEGSVNSLTGDHLNSPRGLPLKEKEVVEDEEEEPSDSGSDGDESSSPDASMSDIIPMLDELHPLLDEEEATQPAHMSNDDGSDTDAALEHSLKLVRSGNDSDSDSDSENQEENEVVEDEEEGELLGDKEEEAKAAITWTEDDQKNLMNLGTSELERNRRLESLIARRRSRKNMRMMAEKNLIDFESTDLTFNVAPISTSRKNPFDLPFDSNDNIPGSAPSILQPRRNPFDLPYDSSEEKPDLVGDTFQQDPITFQLKEPFFRRHESFNVGPSFFGPYRQEKQDIKLRPYFVPERTASEDSNFSFLQRQSSELSESKVSSVHETESIGSAGEMEDKKLIEEDFPQETRVISHTVHGSESSEDSDSADLVQIEKRDVERREIVIKLGGEENHQETESNLFETGSAHTPFELNANVVDLNVEPVEMKDSSSIELTENIVDLNIEPVEPKDGSRSSSSSESDVNEMIFNEKEEELSNFEQNRANIIEEPGVPMQQKEPVYDLSPTSSLKKNLCSSSISSALPIEVIVKRTVSFVERESEASILTTEEHNPSNEETILESSELHEVDEDRMGSREVTDTNHASVDQEDSSDSSAGEDSLQKDRSLGVPHEVQSLVVEQISLTHPGTASFETEEIEEKLMDKEVHPSNADDKSMNQSSDTTEELKEPLIIERESIDVASTSHNLIFSSESQPIPSEVTETDLPPALVDLKHSILDERENGDETRDVDSSPSHVNLQNNIEEEDAIKEIDEGLLSELDAVGDFSVKDSGPYSNEIVKKPVQEDSSAVLETKDIPLKIEEEISKYKDEMASFEDDDSSIREFVHREVENPIDLKSVNDEGEPADSDEKQNPAVEMHVHQDTEPVSVVTEVEHVEAEIRPTMHVLEARSVEDIDSAFKQVHEMEIKKPIVDTVHNEAEPADSEKKQFPVAEMRVHQDTEPVSVVTEVEHVEAEIRPTMHVLEARSVEDIDSAFKQVHEKEIEKPIVDTVHNGSNLTENKLESPVIESRSIEDSTEKLVQSDLEDGLANFEANEAGSSSKDTESVSNELGKRETIADAAEKAKDEVKGEKKKSLKSGSSSSSSSSDSDKE